MILRVFQKSEGFCEIGHSGMRQSDSSGRSRRPSGGQVPGRLDSAFIQLDLLGLPRIWRKIPAQSS